MPNTHWAPDLEEMQTSPGLSQSISVWRRQVRRGGDLQSLHLSYDFVLIDWEQHRKIWCSRVTLATTKLSPSFSLPITPLERN